MSEQNSAGETVRELPDFPTEITFKAVFRNNPATIDVLREILQERDIDAEITMKESKKSTFVSYTVTAVFPSGEVLQGTCSAITLVDGFFTLF
ncbi:MAG TPA: DUF493 family protein [Spirochaetota bacterium]|mgnify:FL=1|nr:DUF493 family protein [Spirochaetota bacterium]HPJ38543.1 DUF493 family protein [Spirochaetota bacterium]HPQ53875.1 DUF493 family protein [Spirochaetota bacterium]